MKEEWKEVEYKGFAKNSEGFDTPVVGTFKFHVGETPEASLISLRDMDGRKFDVSEPEKERIEMDCAYEVYRCWRSSSHPVVQERMRKSDIKIARQLIRLAKSLVASDDELTLEEVQYINWNVLDEVPYAVQGNSFELKNGKATLEMGYNVANENEEQIRKMFHQPKKKDDLVVIEKKDGKYHATLVYDREGTQSKRKELGDAESPRDLIRVFNHASGIFDGIYDASTHPVSE